MSPSTRRGLLVGGVLLILAVGAFAWLGRAANGPRVDAYQAVRRPLVQTLLVTGRLAPPDRVDLGAQVQSTVVEVLVEEGDPVPAGALLARLADDEAMARLAEAEAQVTEASARLRRVRGVQRQVASERVQQARLRFEEADTAYERAAVLYRAGSTTEASHDSARLARDTARSQLVAAQLDAAATQPGGADAVTAAASLARAQAAFELAQAGVERTRLRAPMAGRILSRTAEPGQVVRPGDALFQLAGSGPLQVRVTPDEYHLGRLAEGQQARVVAEAFPERPIAARVDRIAPRIDAARGTVEVVLELTDEVGDLTLLPDMSATVEVVLGERQDALVLPTWLVRDLGTGEPWVLVEDQGLAQRREVTLGLLGADAVEIADGLEPTDLVLSPDPRVGPSDPVRLRPARPALPER